MYFIFILLVCIMGLFLYADIQQIVFGKPFGDKPAPNLVLIVFTLFISSIIFLLFRAKLETRINKEGVFFKWVPFQTGYTMYKWSNIDKAEIISYSFVGYGFRLTPYGTVHTVGGNKGLQLILKSGRKVVIGTQKSGEIKAILESRKDLISDI